MFQFLEFGHLYKKILYNSQKVQFFEGIQHHATLHRVDFEKLDYRTPQKSSMFSFSKLKVQGELPENFYDFVQKFEWSNATDLQKMWKVYPKVANAFFVDIIAQVPYHELESWYPRLRNSINYMSAQEQTKPLTLDALFLVKVFVELSAVIDVPVERKFIPPQEKKTSSEFFKLLE